MNNRHALIHCFEQLAIAFIASPFGVTFLYVAKQITATWSEEKYLARVHQELVDSVSPPTREEKASRRQKALAKLRSANPDRISIQDAIVDFMGETTASMTASRFNTRGAEGAVTRGIRLVQKEFGYLP